MITAAEREGFKKVAGKQYQGKVKAMLLQRGIKNRNGKPFSSSMISMVIQGERENPAIEDVIKSIYETQLEKVEQIKKPEGFEPQV